MARLRIMNKHGKSYGPEVKKAALATMPATRPQIA
jgi:hypothetical protein